MQQKNKIMDAMVVWKYNFNNQDDKEQHNHNYGFRVFDLGLSYDLKYLAIVERTIRGQYNALRGRLLEEKFYFRVKLFEIKLCTIIIESSLQHIGFIYKNYHFSRDSNFLLCQGSFDSYLIIDIQKKKEYFFKNQEGNPFFIFEMETINNIYIWKNDKIFHVNAEQMDMQQEKEINIKFDFDDDILYFDFDDGMLYFKSFLLKFALISTKLFQYIIYLGNCKVIKQRKIQIDDRPQQIIFKNYLIIEEENFQRTEYSVRLLSSGKLLRRIKNLFGNSGYVYEDEHGIYKHVILNIENPINHYQIKIFDFSRGTSKEISYQNKSKYNNNHEISRFFNQFIYKSTWNSRQNQITCYKLR